METETDICARYGVTLTYERPKYTACRDYDGRIGVGYNSLEAVLDMIASPTILDLNSATSEFGVVLDAGESSGEPKND